MYHADKGPLEESLEACAEACRACAGACLREKDASHLAECIRLDFECARLCDIAIGYLDRGSPFLDEILHLCAEACGKCGTECGKHSGMRHCRECAIACERCERACLAWCEAMA